MRIYNIYLSGSIPSKKNQRRVDRKTGKNYPSKRYNIWHEIAGYDILSQRIRKHINCKEIIIKFYFGDKKRTDLTNKAESVMDLLVDLKIINDDCWTNTGKITLIPEYKKGCHGAHIAIHERIDDVK